MAPIRIHWGFFLIRDQQNGCKLVYYYKSNVVEAVKKIGRVDLLLRAEEWDIIGELCTFLKAFISLTDIVSADGWSSGNSCSCTGCC